MKQSLPLFLLPAALLAASIPVSAQDSSSIEASFLHRQVWLKVDMPASKDGLTIYAETGTSKPPKDNLLAYRAGDSATISKVKVDKNHVEVQLDHGGWGIFGDDNDSSPVQWQPVPKTRTELDLEAALQANRFSSRRDREEAQTALDALRIVRQQTDDRARVNADIATQAKLSRLTYNRIHGGSRFNVSYNNRVPADLTPQQLTLALSNYLSFDGPLNASQPYPQQPQDRPQPPTYPAQNDTPPPPYPASNSGTIQKGMTIAQVEQQLGRPTLVPPDQLVGDLTIHTEVFVIGDYTLTATFAGGILASQKTVRTP